MPLTAQGYQRKTYDEFLAEKEELARKLFGENINLSPTGPLGKFIQMLSYSDAEAEEYGEHIYYSRFPDTATGVSLDLAVKFGSMTRLEAIAATGTVKLDVDPGTTIDAGISISTQGDIEYLTTMAVKDEDNDGIVIAPIQAVVPGAAGNVPAGTITRINTPVVGLNAATNEQPTTGGRDRETDKELRDRYADNGADGQSSTVSGIRKTILEEVLEVDSCIVMVNSTAQTDSAGRPPHSFEAIVYGGDRNDIAAAILKAQAAGIQAYGQENVEVVDDSGQTQKIGFTYAEVLNIYVQADVTTDAAYPSNGDYLVRDEIIKYIGGTNELGTTYTGLGMGISLIYNQVVTAVLRNVPGVIDVQVQLSIDGETFSDKNISILQNQVANTSFDKITVV